MPMRHNNFYLPVCALLLLAPSSNAIEIFVSGVGGHDDGDVNPSAAAPSPPAGWKAHLSKVLLAGSVGVGAAGAALCAQALGFESAALSQALSALSSAGAGPAYLAAGASGVGTAIALHKARLAGAETRALRELGAGSQQTLEKQQQAGVDALHNAVGSDMIDSLSKLWKSMKTSDRVATSLDARARRELLQHMRVLGEGFDVGMMPDTELEQAEHFLLRSCPLGEMQAALLAASRAGVAFAQLDESKNDTKKEKPTGFLA